MSTVHERTVIGYTLVDITETMMIRDLDGKELERNQQRNWETVLQCIGLRAQPQNMAWRVDEVSLEKYEFGDLYKGIHKVWSFAFTTDYPGVFDDGKDPIGLLESDFDEVPVVTYLTETARFLLPLFYTAGAIKNIYFMIPDSGVNT
jgi:hypothetical protein